LDVERLDTIIAPFEPCLRMTPAAATCQGAVILSATKLCAQPFCPAIPEKKQPADAYNHNHGECHNERYFYWT
jgi:hypothetical protein